MGHSQLRAITTALRPFEMERPMNGSRFGKKIRLPSTVQIKHQLLVMWLADQQRIEEAARALTTDDAKAHWKQSPKAVSDSV